MEFSRQEYWSGLPFPSPGDLPDPGRSPALQADSLPSEPQGKQALNQGCQELADDRTVLKMSHISYVTSLVLTRREKTILEEKIS